jgi:hypothetical protein
VQEGPIFREFSGHLWRIFATREPGFYGFHLPYLAFIVLFLSGLVSITSPAYGPSVPGAASPTKSMSRYFTQPFKGTILRVRSLFWVGTCIRASIRDSEPDPHSDPNPYFEPICPDAEMVRNMASTSFSELDPLDRYRRVRYWCRLLCREGPIGLKNT